MKVTLRSRPSAGWPTRLRQLALIAVASSFAATALQAQDAADPRVGLAPGWTDAGVAVSNLELMSTIAKAEGFVNPDDPFQGGYSNSDLAFTGSFAVQGNYQGFQILNIEDPNNPTLRTSVVCPGGQGDVSVYGDLLFMSVQDRRARIDCEHE